jgi:hypothetical protein
MGGSAIFMNPHQTLAAKEEREGTQTFSPAVPVPLEFCSYIYIDLHFEPPICIDHRAGASVSIEQCGYWWFKSEGVRRHRTKRALDVEPTHIKISDFPSDFPTVIAKWIL